MSKYKYVELHKTYLGGLDRGNTIEDLKLSIIEHLKSDKAERESAEPDLEEITLELPAEQIELIREQARAYTALTIADQEELSELFQIHRPGEYGYSGDAGVEWKKGFQVNIVGLDGNTEEYHLIDEGVLSRRKIHDHGYMKIINPELEKTVKAIQAHGEKLKQDRVDEVYKAANALNQGNELLARVFIMHMGMQGDCSVHPNTVEINEDVKLAEGLTGLPKSMQFYLVGQNASHQFSLGVHDGKLYKYSCGEGRTFYMDDEGKKYTSSDIDWETVDDEIGYCRSKDGKQVREEMTIDQYISGPYGESDGIGYMGHY